MAPILTSLPVCRVKFVRTVNNQTIATAKVTATPTTPHLTVAGQHGYVDLAPVTSQVDPSDPTVGYLDLVVTDDPDAAETFGWTITFESSTRPARVVSVPQSGAAVTTITVDGQSMPSVWLDALATFTGPSGATGSNTATVGYVDSALDVHEAAADPHPQYLMDGQGTPPTGGAGGALSGSYPNPGFAVDMATQAELDAGLAGIRGPTINAFSPPAGLTAVVGDNSTNDRAALQAQLDWVKANYGGGRVVVSKPNVTGVKLNTGITVPGKVQLVSDETTLFNFSQIASGATAITVNDSNFTPLVGIRMDGGNFTPASDPTNSTVGVSITGAGLTFDKCHIQYFGRGVNLAHDNTFIVTFANGSIARCGVCYYNDIEGAGVGNSGERMVLDNMTLANSPLGFHVSAGGQSLYLTNCSIDFCTEFGRNSNAFVFLAGCHLETGGGAAGPYLFDQSNNGHTFLSNVNVIMGGVYYLFRQDRGPANYAFGSVRHNNVSVYYVDQDGASSTRFSTDMVWWPSGTTTKTVRYPFAMRWCPISVGFVVSDGSTIPNGDVIRISAMDTAAGTLTLTAPAYSGDRWARVSFE